jgi:hypothetical protein
MSDKTRISYPFYALNPEVPGFDSLAETDAKSLGGPADRLAGST